MVVGIGLLSGCSITQDISLLEDDNKKLTYSEDYIVVINPDDIISVAVEEHYGEGHSDARRVEYFVKDGIY